MIKKTFATLLMILLVNPVHTFAQNPVQKITQEQHEKNKEIIFEKLLEVQEQKEDFMSVNNTMVLGFQSALFMIFSYMAVDMLVSSNGFTLSFSERVLLDEPNFLMKWLDTFYSEDRTGRVKLEGIEDMLLHLGVERVGDDIYTLEPYAKLVANDGSGSFNPQTDTKTRIKLKNKLSQKHLIILLHELQNVPFEKIPLYLEGLTKYGKYRYLSLQDISAQKFKQKRNAGAYLDEDHFKTKLHNFTYSPIPKKIFLTVGVVSVVTMAACFLYQNLQDPKTSISYSLDDLAQMAEDDYVSFEAVLDSYPYFTQQTAEALKYQNYGSEIAILKFLLEDMDE